MGDPSTSLPSFAGNPSTPKNTLRTIYCTGSPYDIGYAHGHAAANEIRLNINTYTTFFAETAHITWPQARDRARAQFYPVIAATFPEILEEMAGIVAGAGGGLVLEDILALTVRSEIALTNYADGCTSLAQGGPNGEVFLCQNWDWLQDVSAGTVLLDIVPEKLGDQEPIAMKMLSEAGIAGKIGLNSAGFGLCLNALRSGAMDTGKLPVHIMCRYLLQHARGVDDAVQILDGVGLASAANFVLADSSGRFVDIEASPYANTHIGPHAGDPYPYVAHTNHLYAPNLPPRLKDHPAPNSFARLDRIRELTDADGEKGVKPSFGSIRARLADEEGKPYSICRDRPPGAEGMESMMTIATVLMDLRSLSGEVTLGRPCEKLEVVRWSF